MKVFRVWLKAAWVPTFGLLVNRIWIFDVILVSILMGSTLLIGFFQAARVFTGVIMMGEIFLRVLYPKLMRDRLGSDISISMRLQILVQIPLAVGAFVLAEPLLNILGVNYVLSANILRLLVVVVLIQGIEHLMDHVLLGSDTTDATENPKFHELRKSWLVRLPLLDLVKGLSYLAGLTIVFVAMRGSDLVTLGIYWGLVMGVLVVPSTIIKVVAARRKLPHHLALPTIVKYSLSGIVMSVFLYLYRLSYPFTEASVLGTLSYLAVPGFASIGLYAAITYLLDSYFRSIVSNFLKRISFNLISK